MKYFILFISIGLLCSCTSELNKELTLPALLTDNMVLQQQSDVVFWGTTKAEKEIIVTASWGIEQKVQAEKDGSWKATMATPESGGPYSVTVSTSDTSVQIQNVMIGEVWLASGQSNMEMPLKGWPPRDTINYSAKEVAAANYSDIRMFTVVNAVSDEPLDKVEGRWAICNPENAKEFSATAYFFARELHQRLNVPIGIINSSWGGTPAESWVSKKSLATLEDFKTTVDLLESTKSERVELLNWLATKTAIEHPTLVNENTYASMDFKGEAALTADASTWPTMEIPQFWEATEVGDFDGVIWFKKTIELTEVPAGNVTLKLGPVDDMDVTYVNGVKVGEVLTDGAWQLHRNYTIPAGVLKVGKNVIDVQSIDLRGGGGIWGGKESVCIHNDLGDTISLHGSWSYIPVSEFRNNHFYLFDVASEEYKSRPTQSIQLTSWTPSALYNAMIAPLLNYKIKGAIWYQGESNVGRAEQYERLFPTLISDWRAAFGEIIPFYFAQIAPHLYDPTQQIGLSPALREAQRKTLALEKTGMVVTMDIGNNTNIHPANKQDVGLRMAKLALQNDYKLEGITANGPLVQGFTTDGGKAIVNFTNAEGLELKSGSALFEVTGADGNYYVAEPSLLASSVELSAREVENPIAVRYAWRDTVTATLFNGAGLPASSFELK